MYSHNALSAEGNERIVHSSADRIALGLANFGINQLIVIVVDLRKEKTKITKQKRQKRLSF